MARSEQQIAAARIIDRRLRKILTKLSVRGHCFSAIGGGIKPRNPIGVGLFYGAVPGDSNKFYRISINGQEITLSSKTLAQAKQALALIQDIADEQANLVNPPPPDDFNRLASILRGFKEAKLPLLRNCPGYLSHSDVPARWHWYTTMDSEAAIELEQRFSVAVIDSLDPVFGSLGRDPQLVVRLRDTFSNPDASPPLPADLLGAMRDICSVLPCLDLNEKFLAAIQDDRTLELVKATLGMECQGLEGPFKPDPDEMFDPGVWARKIGDIEKMNMAAQGNFFDALVVEPQGEYQPDIPEIAGPIRFAFKLHRVRSMFTKNKVKFQNWNRVSQGISREFQERFESLYTFRCSLKNGSKIVTKKVSGLYGCLVAVQLAEKEKITEKDVLSAKEKAEKTVQGIVRASYNAVFDVFCDKFRQTMEEYNDGDPSEGQTAGRIVPKAPPRDEWESREFAAQLAKLLEQFNLTLSKWLQDNDPGWAGPNKERALAVNVGNQKKLAVIVGDKCRISRINLAYTNRPDITTVHFTGLTKKTMTQNMLDKFYDTDCTRKPQWSEYIDDIVYRREEILQTVHKTFEAYMDNLQRAAVAEAEHFSQILQTDFSEDLFEDYCTAGPNA